MIKLHFTMVVKVMIVIMMRITKTTVLECLFDKVARPKASNKNRLKDGCIPNKFVNFLIAP